MEINLLPRPSVAEKYRVPVLVIASLLLVAGSGAAWHYGQALNRQIEQARVALQQVQGDQVVLMAERTVLPETQEFRALQAAVQAVVHAEHQTAAWLDAIAGKLAAQTEVVDVSYQREEQALTLDLHVESINVTADLAESLRQEPWIQEVSVAELQKREDSVRPFTAKLTLVLRQK